MLGEHANRVNEVELALAELVDEKISFDERHQVRRQRDAANRTPRALEHRMRDVDADEAPHVRERVKITAGAAAEIEDVNRSAEAIAHAAEPRVEPRRRRSSVERIVVLTVLLGVRIVVERHSPCSPPCERLAIHADLRATNPLTPATRKRRRVRLGKNRRSTWSLTARFHALRGIPR